MKQLLLLFVLITGTIQAQHTVSGNFAPADHYKWGIVYKVTPTSTQYAIDARMDSIGNFTINLDEKITPGMYKMVYGLPTEDNSFDFVYNGKEDIELKFVEGEGVSFISSEENLLWNQYVKEMDVLENEINTYLSQEKKEGTLEPYIKVQEELQNSYEELTKGKYVESFVKASRQFAPKKFTTNTSYIENNRKAYFDYVDVKNPVVQNSSIVYNKILGYISGAEDIDAVATFLTPASKEYQKSILQKIWQAAVDRNVESVANEVGLKHLMPLAKELKDTALVNTVFKYSRISIGSQAPTFTWKDEETEKTMSLSDLKDAENYILVFWSSTCSHCLNELPKLQTTIKTFPKKKYKVIAFGIEDNIYDWKNATYDLADFIHVPGLGKWDNDVAKSYSISQTPTYFLLDADKKIIAKPDDLEALKPLLTQEVK